MLIVDRMFRSVRIVAPEVEAEFVYSVLISERSSADVDVGCGS